jgi:hypothetical protein
MAAILAQNGKMDPVFTLQYPEFILANKLRQLLPKSQNYSVMIPVSRQEKGIDLAVLFKAQDGGSRVATVQIKASRTYMPEPPKRETTKRFNYYTWFNRFSVPEIADFILLFGMYIPAPQKLKKMTPNRVSDCTLIFTRDEMKVLMTSCLTVGGKPDKMFGFGFDDLSNVVQTRGDKDRRMKDYSDHLMDKRINMIRAHLEGPRISSSS